MTPRIQFALLAPLALLLIVFVVYYPGLSGGFLFDDFPNIVTNARVHMGRVDLGSLQRAALAYQLGGFSRPLATITFGLNYYWGGLDPYGYKAVGLAIHLANALLVYVLVSRLWPRSENAQRSWIAPMAIALAWAVHPLQVSSTLYVVQRMETLSFTFVFAGLILYVEGRHRQIEGRGGWATVLASFAVAAIGLLSKESAALFPLLALCLELTLFQFRAQQQLTSRALRVAYSLGGGVAAVIMLTWVIPHFASTSAYRFRDFNAYERLLTQFRVLALYLWQIALPLPQNLHFYYDSYRPSTGWLHPWTTLVSAIALLALLLSAFAARRRQPLYALGILWFFVAHAITSNIFPLELVFEHRNYFALLGVVVAASDLIARVPMAHGPALKRVAVAACIVFLAFLGVLRAASWGKPLQLATELSYRDPQSARASSDLATLYFSMADGNPDSPFFSMASAEFERASKLPSASSLPEQGLILMKASAGLPVPKSLWNRLDDKLSRTVVGPEEMATVSGLLENRAKDVPLDDSELARTYAILSARASLPSSMYVQLATHSLMRLHDEKAAARYFILAVHAAPEDREFAARLSAQLIADGYHKAASDLLLSLQR